MVGRAASGVSALIAYSGSVGLGREDKEEEKSRNNLVAIEALIGTWNKKENLVDECLN